MAGRPSAPTHQKRVLPRLCNQYGAGSAGDDCRSVFQRACNAARNPGGGLSPAAEYCAAQRSSHQLGGRPHPRYGNRSEHFCHSSSRRRAFSLAHRLHRRSPLAARWIHQRGGGDRAVFCHTLLRHAIRPGSTHPERVRCRRSTGRMSYFHWIAGSVLGLVWFWRLADAALGGPKIADVSRSEWDRNPVAPQGNPRVTIIVPARNEGQDIEQTLSLLLSLDYDNYEVIAVDDRSTDRTGEIMDRIAASAKAYGCLKVIHIDDLA